MERVLKYAAVQPHPGFIPEKARRIQQRAEELLNMQTFSCTASELHPAKPALAYSDTGKLQKFITWYKNRNS
ncbi:hypothetical protein [Pectinatus haikarae]|uniref:Uncharacterized protein n=1 Tax=Pectinatus haikarae TaxID=349096 RepID=A0ABT9YCH5_9FIRM|nr:hypothetical protein [Pectinatus haikarae]MDQ0205170.1 hypothetical protein [Pectinatus haikarae]